MTKGVGPLLGGGGGGGGPIVVVVVGGGAAASAAGSPRVIEFEPEPIMNGMALFLR